MCQKERIGAMDLLKEMRVKAGLQQRQVAAYLGTTQEFVSGVEAGEKKLTADQLENLMSLYGRSLAEFKDAEKEVYPIWSFPQTLSDSRDDLHAMAEIGRIAANSRFMARAQEEK